MNSDEGELELGLSLGGCGKVEFTNVPSRRTIFTANDMPRGFSARKTKTPPAGSTTLCNQAVGWPPVRSYRVNNLITQTKSAQEEDNKTNNLEPDKTDQYINKEVIKGYIRFVKVNMNGLPIGRKVDLNAHMCYETLAQAIENMFFKSTTSGCGIKTEASNISELLDGSLDFVLTYEDKEREWLLVGDVPWRMFLSTVKRLRIMRTSEANGLGIRLYSMYMLATPVYGNYFDFEVLIIGGEALLLDTFTIMYFFFRN